MDWQEEPATNQQMLRLQQYGFVPSSALTVTEAARLIRRYSKHPLQAQARSASTHASEESGAVLTQAPPGTFSEAARVHAYHFRVAVLDAEQTANQNPDAPGVKADLKAAVTARQQFWVDTCRDFKELQSVSVFALEFYQYFGARFFPPTWQEVQEVLDALDGAMPAWDKDHQELFYETLKLNFPSLLRHR